MSKNKEIIKLMSGSYIILYGGILGFNMYKNIPLLFWLIIIFIGGILMTIKLSRIKSIDANEYKMMTIIDISSLLLSNFIIPIISNIIVRNNQYAALFFKFVLLIIVFSVVIGYSRRRIIKMYSVLTSECKNNK